MPIESTQVYEAYKRAMGVKAMTAAMATSPSHTYMLLTPCEARDPQQRDDIERITALCERSATRGREGEEANELTEQYFTELFDRLNRGHFSTPLTCEVAVRRAQELCEHFAGVLKSCKPGFVPDEVAVEATEMIVALKALVRCAEAVDDGPSGENGLRLPARLRA